MDLLTSPAFTSPLNTIRPQRVGEIESVVGLLVQVRGLDCWVGEVVLVGDGTGIPAEVIALDAGLASCMPLNNLDGLRVGSPVRGTGLPATMPIGPALLGRVIDTAGRPIDGKRPIYVADHVPAHGSTPNALECVRIDTPVAMGIHVLDTLVTLGRGQRIGLFAGSGVDRPTLMSMITRGTNTEVCVIALVGERGRKVREFLEDDLGEKGLPRSMVVAATPDGSPMLRKHTALTTARVAEYYRGIGRHVLLIIDSLTRTCMAQREIELSVGESPAMRGYPPSTFPIMAQLLERAGSGMAGSVTGIYTVLVGGDDHDRPIVDQARSILDGHVVLDRKLAVAGHYPAVDTLVSISRVASKVYTREQKEAATTLRQVMGAERGVQDLLGVGAYQQGTNPEVGLALQYDEEAKAFLTRKTDEEVTFDETWQQLFDLYQSFQKEQAA